ncbi:MAG: hypothetical protein WD118_01445 [Phycisphaeraceae bacterium]
MSITVEEKFGRQFSDDQGERVYLIKGTTSEVTARSQLAAAAPSLLGTLVLDDVAVEEIEGMPDGAFIGTAQYRSVTPPEDGDDAFQFETRGGTQRITQSLQTVASYAPVGETAPDFDGAINVTEQSIEGTDIVVPVFSFTSTRYHDTLTQAYIGQLYQLTGRTNNASWSVNVNGTTLQFAEQEVLFLGAAGSQRGDQPWELSLAFAASPNVTGLSVGQITGIAKKGWEHLWVRYKQDVDETAKVMIYKPTAAYIEQVYHTGDFSVL